MSQGGLAAAVWPGMEREEKYLAEAQKQLELVKSTPTSEVERIARIEANARAISNVETRPTIKIPVAPMPSDRATLEEELRFLAHQEPVSPQKKAEMIKKAEEEVAVRTKAVIEAAQQRGYVERTIRILRKGATLLLVSDILGRVYVWNVLEASPTLSPIGTFSIETIRSLIQD
ncbi:MAG: hypothetical protein HC902_08575 [Calothrix sp. SM1_5_4]|nr:hypothetical protein [Calothrix sp. SM1_5_4]